MTRIGIIAVALAAASPALADDCAALDAELSAALETRIDAAGDRLDMARANHIAKTAQSRDLMAKALAGQADFDDVDAAEIAADTAGGAAFAALRAYDRLTGLRDAPLARASELDRAEDWAACAE